MELAKVRLRKPNRVYTFLCNNIPIQRNDHCIVRTERGLEFGICVVPPYAVPDDELRQTEMKVIRRATPTDEETQSGIAEEEAKAHRVCAEKIAESGLPMKLIDAEYTFDKRKVTFYFTADQRVDFRVLVRDLAHVLKTRIELRHIQVRDQAKMVGGLGECGRVLCCRSWLGDFLPISMKMAKRQNLSLNPEKISGQCGRLMCCLSYENGSYRDKKKASQVSDDDSPLESPDEADSEEDVDAGLESEGLDDTGDDDARPGAPSSGGSPAAAGPREGAEAQAARKSRRKRRRRNKKGEGDHAAPDHPAQETNGGGGGGE
ncbi:MAG TPA: stage 0 sporulation family protein [Candidatus Hydrogenedentes bacterium]|nr:stage 0 sporulation family protein [Candidatus Hydrogenedentota bacterium]HPG68804.1 stage 0 sporulation family protein [Candidatus Hydrogenedentota bacterium]